MKIIQITVIVSLLGIGQFAFAQQVLTPQEVVQKAISNSPKVQSSNAKSEQTENLLKSKKAGFNPQLDIAPGIGFTNSNAIIGQELDIFGRRVSEARVIESQLKVDRLYQLLSQTEVAFVALNGYAELLSAQDSVENAQLMLNSAQELLVLVRKQFEIGEVPEVQVTRAELEVMRYQQGLAQAENLRLVTQADINSLTGIKLTEQVRASVWTSVSLQNDSNSPEWLISQAEIDVAESELQAVRNSNRPRLSAGVTSDIWSVDRSKVLGDNFGFQLSFSMPLYDSGETRFAVKAAEAEKSRRQANSDEVKRVAELSFERAQIAVKSTAQVLQSYSGDILPKGEAMVASMRSGYQSGLVSLIEVLEAQQALSRLRQDHTNAERNHRLAQLELMKATTSFPGLEVQK